MYVTPRNLIFSILTVCLASITSAQQNLSHFIPDTTALVNPWTSKPFPNRDTIFQFAIISDLTGGYREDNAFPEAMNKVNMLGPEFVMSVGDLIEGYTEDSAQILRWWNQFDGWIERLKYPFFYVPGNHDLSNSVMTRIYERRYGRAYYHFVYRNVLFLVMSTEDGHPAATGGPGNIGPQQIAYFKEVLAAHKSVDWTLVLMHRPMWFPGEPGFDGMDTLLQDRDYTVFAGHAHTYIKEKRFGRNYYSFATTGGGSDLYGPEFGEFDEIAWITMTPSGPEVANITLEGILPDDVRTTETRPIAWRFKESARVSNLPLIDDGKSGGSVSTALLINNKLLVSMHIQGRFYQHPVIRISESELDTMLGPGQALSWPVRLDFNTSAPKSTLPPIQFQWSMEATALGRDFHRSETYAMSVQPVFTSIQAPKNIQIDGSWEEWGNATPHKPDHLGYFIRSWRGLSDLAYDTRVAHDKENIYLALRVFDDSLLYTPYRASWEQEGAELSLRLPNQSKLSIGFSPGLEPSTPLVDVRKNWPKGSRLLVSKRADGFIAEIAIPKAELEKLNGAAFQRFQLQWTIYDHDGMEDQYKGTQAFCFPEQPGSGTFELK